MNRHKREFNQRSTSLVWVFDDEPEIRDYIAKAVTQLGYECASFENPTLVIDQLKKVHPDLIITDLNMPRMSGMDFIHKLREQSLHIPVLIVSAYVTKEVCIDALKKGAAAIIEKPFKREDLVPLITLNINRYKSYRLLSRSINFMNYQFSDLEKYLTVNGQHELRDMMKEELQTILAEKRKLDKSAYAL